MKAILFIPFVMLLASLLLVGCANNQPIANSAAIASPHPLATQAGFRALDQGGNAFDAAVAAAAVLSVVQPHSAGLGGGSIWLLQKRNGQATVVDAIERAPERWQRNMYLGKNEVQFDKNNTWDGPSTAAIPGQPAALAYISKIYGIRPLTANLNDAIKLAESGFRVDKIYRTLASDQLSTLNKYNTSKSLFLENGAVPSNGYIVRQPSLAITLSRLGSKGHKGFYGGTVAKQLLSDVNAGGRVWTSEDLKNYQIIEREPIEFKYRNATIISAPPPSYGGIALQRTLNILDRFDTTEMDVIEKTHLIVEVMRRVYRDAAAWSGDPDFVDIPVDQLNSGSYLSHLASDIDPDKATPSTQSPPLVNNSPESVAGHISVLDKWGNKVSVTQSINGPFGSSFTSQKTGVLLNNEMMAFSIRSNKPNISGITDNKQNAIEPGKRPATNMTPTIMTTPNSSAIIGSSGGSRTSSILLLAIMDYVEGKSVDKWVKTPRYYPMADVIEHEANTFSSSDKKSLADKGHKLKELKLHHAYIQAIYIDNVTGIIEAASDSRGSGQAIVR